MVEGGGGSEGEGYMGGSFHGGRDFSIKEAPDFPALFKKRSEIKFKKTSLFN